MPKLAYQIFLGALMFSFVAVACNNKEEKKPAPTEEVKPAETPKETPPAAAEDTVKKKPTDPGN